MVLFASIIDRLPFIQPLFKRFPVLKQFIKFGIVGVINTFIDFAIYFSLTRLFGFFQEHYLFGNFIAFSCAATSSYFMNKHWTFRDKSKQISIQYIKFFLVCFVGLLLTELILFSLVHFVQIYDLLAKVAAVVVVMFWNFLINKFWTFKDNK